MRLSTEKTRISHISDGFNFLGFNFRKYKHKLLVQPENGKASELAYEARELLKHHHGITFHVVLTKLDRLLRGWGYAYRKVVAKKRMAWIARSYRKRINGRVDFCATYSKVNGERKQVKLFRLADIPIRYHTKIIGAANPYLPEYAEYFANRIMRNKWLALQDRIHMNSSTFEKLAA